MTATTGSHRWTPLTTEDCPRTEVAVGLQCSRGFKEVVKDGAWDSVAEPLNGRQGTLTIASLRIGRSMFLPPALTRPWPRNAEMCTTSEEEAMGERMSTGIKGEARRWKWSWRMGKGGVVECGQFQLQGMSYPHSPPIRLGRRAQAYFVVANEDHPTRPATHRVAYVVQ